MLPVWQEVPHHSMGPELNSTVRNDSTQNPELIYIVSHHLFVEDCAHTCTQSGRDKHLNMGPFGHACLWANTHTHVYTHADVVMYPTIWVKGTVCSGFTHLQESKGLYDKIFFSHFYSLSFYASLPVCVSYSLTHYFTVLLLESVCVLVRTVKLMNDQPWQIHSPDPGAAGEETNGKLGLWRSQS